MMMETNRFHLADHAAELDDATVTEVAIGLADGPGGRFRALGRMRATVREAVSEAGRTARRVARESQGRLLDPAARPAAIRISRRPDGATLLLDYDVKGLSGRMSRPLRLVMMTRGAARRA